VSGFMPSAPLFISAVSPAVRCRTLWTATGLEKAACIATSPQRKKLAAEVFRYAGPRVNEVAQ